MNDQTMTIITPNDFGSINFQSDFFQFTENIHFDLSNG
jgi:hypothetical protein